MTSFSSKPHPLPQPPHKQLELKIEARDTFTVKPTNYANSHHAVAGNQWTLPALSRFTISASEIYFDKRGSFSLTFQLIVFTSLHNSNSIGNVPDLRYNKYFPLISYLTKESVMWEGRHCLVSLHLTASLFSLMDVKQGAETMELTEPNPG